MIDVLSYLTGPVIEIQAENIPIGSEHEPILKKEPYVKISMKDHGTGITKQHIDKVFDPFFTTKKKGNGLDHSGRHGRQGSRHKTAGDRPGGKGNRLQRLLKGRRHFWNFDSLFLV